VAVGPGAGVGTQGNSAIAIGNNAGSISQNSNAIAIGNSAGYTNQHTGSIAIGNNAGMVEQGTGAIAIGDLAGVTNQGSYSICIGRGAGSNGQPANTILINADGISRVSALSNTCIINPIRVDVTTGLNALVWNPVTGEVINDGAKSFIINHPLDENKYLIHACLEGPESGIYYRGNSKIIENNEVVITLPDYVARLGSAFTVHLTQYTNNYDPNLKPISSSKVKLTNGKALFKVFGENGSKFSWIVHAKRNDIKVEVNKQDIEVHGDGPYKWYS
jgi:hypothetical protein